MGFLDLLGFTPAKSSSQTAKDRLRIIVESNPRSAMSKHLQVIQKEIFEILAKYLKIPREDFSMNIDESKGKTTIELSVQSQQQGI